jgi:hypothetical protein
MLQGIMGIAGVLGGLSGAQAGRRTMGKGMGYMEEGHQYALESLRRRLDYYNNTVASGGYNPQKSYDFATKAAQRSFKIGSNNMAARMGGLGYKNGDSNVAQDQRHFSEKSQMDLSNMLLQIQDRYQQMQNQDMASLDQSAQNFARYDQGLGREIYGYGQQQAAAGTAGMMGALGSLAGNKFDFLKMGKRTSVSDPYAQARNDFNPNHVYDQNGNLIP